MDIRNPLLTGDAIAERAKAIGVPLSRLAGEAGLAASTPYRWGTKGSNARTLRAMQKVLEARERALLASLLELHPDIIARDQGDAA